MFCTACSITPFSSFFFVVDILLTAHFLKKCNVSSWAPIWGKMAFIWQLICVMCSLALCECVKFSLNIYKTGEQHTCRGVIPPLMGCFCENLRGCVIGRLQVVFERQLDLNSSSRWHGCCLLVRICTGERVSKLRGSTKRWNISLKIWRRASETAARRNSRVRRALY